MFLPIANQPRNYEWGSLTAISDLLGRPPSGRPEAELWLGDHPGSPAQILDPDLASGCATLDQWIAADELTALGTENGDGQLPFLMKILAADAPLSLQAHPTREQAQAGYIRENRAGIAVDAAHRNYKDSQHKPEVIYALSDTFDAVCGFRAIADIQETLRKLGNGRVPQSLEPLSAQLRSGLRGTVSWLLSAPSAASLAIREVITAAQADTALARDDAQLSTVRLLAKNYPYDPGILLSLLLNRVSLHRGEALFLPPGNIHAYLQGVGVEVMASSDNVLRGGLTNKHIDIPELMDVLSFEPIPIPYLAPHISNDGTESFEPDIPDFRLIHKSMDTQSVFMLEGPAIVACTMGETTIRGARSTSTLGQGDFLFVTPDELRIEIDTGGEVFVATAPLSGTDSARNYKQACSAGPLFENGR